MDHSVFLMIHGINAPRSVWGVEVFEFYDLVTDRQRDAHSFHKQTNVSSVWGIKKG